jgi:transcriptional regulator with XRE-family HTH domain
MFPNLDAEMARQKMTRTELAKRINKTPTTLSLKLNGKAPITLNECVEIKEAINPQLSIDYLFDTEERPAAV